MSTWVYPQDQKPKKAKLDKETEKKEEEVLTREPDQNETSKKSSKEETTVDKHSSGEVRITNG